VKLQNILKKDEKSAQFR